MWTVPRVALAMAVLVLAILAHLPIHVSEVTRADPSLTLGAAPEHRAGAVAAPLEIVITWPGGSPIVLEQVRDARGVLLRLPPAPSGWTAIEHGMVAESPDRPLRLDVSVGQLNFNARSTDGQPGTVLVTVNGSPHPPLEVAGDEVASLSIDSGASIHRSTHRYRLRPLVISGGSEVQAWLGTVPLQLSERADGTVAVPTGEPLRVVALGLWSMAGVVAVAIGAALALLAFGWAVLGNSPGRPDPDPHLALALGAAMAALGLGAINYVLPARTATLIVVGAATSLALWRWRAAGLSPVDVVHQYRALIGRTSLGAPAGLVVVFLGLPVALTGGTNLGMLQTDIFDYFNVQRVYWDQGIVESGLDWGNGLRSIDSSVRSAVIGWTPLAAREGFHAVRFTAVLIALATIGGACRALGARQAVVLLVQVGFLSIASLNSLWVEGYLSRELFVWIAIPAVAVSVRVIGQSRAGSVGEWLALGVVYAWPAALVPPFMVTLLTPAVGLLAVWQRTGRGRAGWRAVRSRALGFGGVFLVGLGLNGRWILNVEKANQYANSVENIGKTFVVPFYAMPQFPASALGLSGFHTNPISWQGPKTLDGLAWPLDDVLRVTNGVAASWTASVLAMLALLLVSVAAMAHADGGWRWSVGALLAPAWSVAFFVPVLVDVAWETQSFFVLMWVWTMSALLLGPILIGASALRGRLGALVGLPLGVLMAFNLASTGLETAMWFSHPQGEGASYHHYDVAADVLAVQEVIDGTARRDYWVAQPVSVTGVDDDDRVLLNQLAIDLEGDGARCVNCVRDPRNGSVTHADSTVPQTADWMVVIGANRCAVGDPVYEGVLIALCDMRAATAVIGASRTAAG